MRSNMQAGARLALLVAAIAVVSSPRVLVSQDASADLAKRLQARYEAIRDFSADFTHTYEGGILRKKTTERGTVLVKKPGKMRWTYTSPEEKLFVSDGRKLYAYVPADRQVTISTLPQADEAATPALFLMGRGHLLKDFTSTIVEMPGAAAGSVAVQLMPRARVPEYESLTMVVDRQALTLRMLVARDAQAGTSTFTFANLKENVGLPDSRFTFTIPRGADVVTQD